MQIYRMTVVRLESCTHTSIQHARVRIDVDRKLDNQWDH